jgi:hypothetical protein
MLGLFVLRRAWEGPSSSPEPTALFSLLFYGPCLCYFFPPYNLSFFGDDLIFTEPKTVKQKRGPNSVGRTSEIAFIKPEATFAPSSEVKPNQMLA